tara:strand:+ start:504 stop:1142 length:639 start_codon:yes stop_codon:yes gene_type:complete
MLTKNQLNRIKNLRRLLFWSAWKRVFLFITEPGHDKLFERFKKINKNIYLTKPEPWLTFTAIDFIKERLQEGLKILEWGSGSSSLWFDQNRCMVTAIEHNEDWANTVKEMKSENIHVIIEKEKSDYVRPAINFSTINIFLIDGIYRNECASCLVELIKSSEILSGAMIIFDDTSRLEYQESVQSLTKCCQEVYHFTGISNIVIDKMTSVFII